DTADPQALAHTLTTIPTDHPLTAVIHTAGTADDRPFSAITPEQLEQVLRPKAQSVLNLHELTLDHDLAAFVLYSSFGSLLPNVGQGAYAAANAYLDAFAEFRRSLGLPATSIAWGAWAGSGMAGEQDFQEWIGLGGMDLMTPHLGVVALQQALDHGDTTVAIANVDWERVAERSSASRPHPLVAELIGTHGKTADTVPGADGPSPLELLAALPPAQRREKLLDVVCGELATVLGHSRSRTVEVAQAFKDLGIDSVTAIELRNRIGSATGIRFSPIAVFDHPSSEALAEHLSNLVAATEEPADTTDKTAEPDPDGREASTIDSLAIEDLVRMARGEILP
ncbi:beta-ketoacyl reductase, partial [Streptomyces sp. NPDC017524]|uniref:beta-ketoacyl reductase n=1 Tax=unclassified Streptomyces TaxID=2593676 RepID=UPI0037BA82D1